MPRWEVVLFLHPTMSENTLFEQMEKMPPARRWHAQKDSGIFIQRIEHGPYQQSFRSTAEPKAVQESLHIVHESYTTCQRVYGSRIPHRQVPTTTLRFSSLSSLPNSYRARFSKSRSGPSGLGEERREFTKSQGVLTLSVKIDSYGLAASP